jgi:ATP-dependent helicase Lhr and Lhr-like helicase
MLERHGVVTREAVLAEGTVGGFASIYGVLKTMEERGQVRRGYFIDGLGAAQFAMPGAIDRLRDQRLTDSLEPHFDELPPALVLAATDPAQPYGATLAWPHTLGRPTRSAGALVVVSNGKALAWCDPRSHHLVAFEDTSSDHSWVQALIAVVKDGRRRQLEIRKINGVDPHEYLDLVEILKVNGFVEGYRGLVLRD